MGRKVYRRWGFGGGGDDDRVRGSSCGGRIEVKGKM